jgi:hypothetical protein
LATRGDNSASILINNGNGSFAAPVLYPTGLDSWGVTTGDLDGDGDDDVAVTNADLRADTVSVLLNNGDGTFSDQVAYQTGPTPTALTAADLDGDGQVDIATANHGNTHVSVLLNNGDGVFGSDVLVEAGMNPGSVVIADLDGDTDPDLASTRDFNRVVSVMLNDGSGAFSFDDEYATAESPWSVRAGLVDNNASLDLVTANNDADNISVLLNNGDATFATHATYAAGRFPSDLALAYLDANAFVDVVVVQRLINNGQGWVSVLLNDGDGTFGPFEEFQVGPGPRRVVAGNFNGDSHVDVATTYANPPDQGVSILLGVGDGTFSPRIDYPSGSQPRGIAAGDLDGDNDLDLAVTNRTIPSGFSTVTILINNGGGVFAAGVPYDVGDNPFDVAIGDLDGDRDVAVVNFNGHNISVLLNNGDGTFAEQIKFGVGSQPDAIAIDDLDGDGDLEIVATNDIFQGKLSVLINRTIP